MRSLVLGLAALTLTLTGCPQKDAQYCNDHPDDPDCIPEAGVVGGLTYRSREIVDGGVVQLGVCGEYTRSIDWLMPDGAPSDGYIVQRVESLTAPICRSLDGAELHTCAETVPPGCRNADGTLNEIPLLRTWWETWPISEDAVSSDGRDTWSIDAHATPTGTATVVGEARYYSAEQMGPEHQSRC